LKDIKNGTSKINIIQIVLDKGNYHTLVVNPNLMCLASHGNWIHNQREKNKNIH